MNAGSVEINMVSLRSLFLPSRLLVIHFTTFFLFFFPVGICVLSSDVSYFRSRNVHSSVESQPEDPGSEPWITMLPTSKRCEDMTQELVASSDQLQERPHTFFAEESSPTSLSTPCSSPHPLMDCFSSHSNSDSIRWQNSDEENENRRTLEMSDIFSEDAVQTIVEYDIQ